MKDLVGVVMVVTLVVNAVMVIVVTFKVSQGRCLILLMLTGDGAVMVSGLTPKQEQALAYAAAYRQLLA